MARRFAIPGNQTTISSSFKTAVLLIASTTVRPKIYHFVTSTMGAAADGVIEVILQRSTVSGTTTAVTPRNIDGGDPSVAQATAGSNATAEPTYTANSSLFDEGVNQRATYTWNAWTEGAQLVSASAATNGIGLAALSSVAPAYTGQMNAHFHYEE